MNIAIVEDEEISAIALEKAIKEFNPGYHVVIKLPTVQEAIDWFSKEECDLIFMDIELTDGTSFNIFKHVALKAPVVFVTGYDQYAIEAFEVNSFDYILKPITEEKISRCFSKYRKLKHYFLQKGADDYRMLEKAIYGAEYKSKFLVNVGNKLIVLRTDQVAYFHAIDRFCFLVTWGGEEYLIDETLEDLKNLLDPREFFRLNRQVMARFDAIKDIYPHFKSRLKVTLKPAFKNEIVISTNRTPKFREWANR